MSESNASLALQQQLSRTLQGHGFNHIGFTKLTTPTSIEIYKSWINEGLHGSMEYLARHLPYKENPEALLQSAKSVIVVACDYVPHPVPDPTLTTTGLRVASYARGVDYHIWLKKRLTHVIEDLKKDFPDDEFIALTDSAPLLERDYAYKAGLGWVGKNTCLIDKKRGSLFLLGEIITTLQCTASDFESDHSDSNVTAHLTVQPDHCGTCNRCIEACPTKAFIEPRKLDARKCISYLTIESKKVPPLKLRSKIGDHFFGCDICQNVCPWNEKVFGLKVKEEQTPKLQVKDELIRDLRFILTSSNKNLESHFKNSPLSRARGFGLKRNALVVSANQKIKVLVPEISNLTSDFRLGELAKWALDKLTD